MMLNHYCRVSFLFIYLFIFNVTELFCLPKDWRISPQAKSYYKMFIKSFLVSATDTDIFLMCLVSFEATIFVTTHKSLASIFSVISERLIEAHNFQIYPSD